MLLPVMLGIISKGRAKKLGFAPEAAPPTKMYPGERMPKAPVEKLAPPEKGILSGPTEKAVRKTSKPYKTEPPLYEDVVQGLREKLLADPELAQSTIGEGGSMTRVANALRSPAREMVRKIKTPELTQDEAQLRTKESRARQQFFQKHGRQPSERMAARLMGMTPEEYRKFHAINVAPSPAKSIRFGQAAEETPREEAIVEAPQEKGGFTPQGLSIEDKVSFQKALQSLTPVERKILLSIFSEEDLPHHRIAKELGVNPMAVSRMYSGAIKKLQAALGVGKSSGKMKDQPSAKPESKADPRDKISNLISQIREQKFGKEHKFEPIKSRERKLEEAGAESKGLKGTLKKKAKEGELIQEGLLLGKDAEKEGLIP